VSDDKYLIRNNTTSSKKEMREETTQDSASPSSKEEYSNKSDEMLETFRRPFRSRKQFDTEKVIKYRENDFTKKDSMSSFLFVIYTDTFFRYRRRGK